MLGYLLVAGTAVLVMAGILTLTHARALRRTREMRALARRMGWRFQPDPPLDLVPDRKRFGLFAVRMHQRVRNHLAGAVGDFQVAVFDLRQSTTRDRGMAGSAQTVVHVRSPLLELPSFSLRPERVFHRPGDRVGGADIDLRKDPEFSRAYHLAGRDVEGIRDLFDAPVRDVYKRHPGSASEGAGRDFFFWMPGELASAGDVDARVRTALELARLHGRGAYQITGRTHGNHTPHVAARMAARRRADRYDDVF